MFAWYTSGDIYDNSREAWLFTLVWTNHASFPDEVALPVFQSVTAVKQHLVANAFRSGVMRDAALADTQPSIGAFLDEEDNHEVRSYEQRFTYPKLRQLEERSL